MVTRKGPREDLLLIETILLMSFSTIPFVLSDRSIAAHTSSAENSILLSGSVSRKYDVGSIGASGAVAVVASFIADADDAAADAFWPAGAEAVAARHASQLGMDGIGADEFAIGVRCCGVDGASLD